jgi:hypothetical protein
MPRSSTHYGAISEAQLGTNSSRTDSLSQATSGDGTDQLAGSPGGFIKRPEFEPGTFSRPNDEFEGRRDETDSR